MTHEEEITQLKEQLSDMLEQLGAVSEQLSQIQERESQLLERLSAEQAEKRMLQESLAAAHKRIEELEKQPRKKRDPKHNRARRREEPTQIVEHRIASCPVCSSRLGGVSVARRRQVIELPPPPPVEVTEHVVYHGWCSECEKWREAPLDVSAEVIGRGRMGVKLASVMAYLRTVMRLPVRQIQAYLATLHGLKISSGEIVELVHRAKAKLEPLVAALK